MISELFLIFGKYYYFYCEHFCKYFLIHACTYLVLVQSLNPVHFLETQWTVAHQAPLFSTNSQHLLKFMSIESVMLSNPLILSHPLHLLPSIFPSSGSFPMSWLFISGGQSIGVSASASGLPRNIQGWFPLGLIGLFSLQYKGLSRVLSSTTIWKHRFLGAHMHIFCWDTHT